MNTFDATSEYERFCRSAIMDDDMRKVALAMHDDLLLATMLFRQSFGEIDPRDVGHATMVATMLSHLAALRTRP